MAGAREIVFCERNRAADLARLIEAYEAVAATARARRGDRGTAAPSHPVVLIHAERGLGKTRLAMELYRHLTTHHDPQGYWPDDYERDADKVSVRPRIDENWDFSARPQFLWLEIEIKDGPNPGNPVFDVQSDLHAHLATVRLAARNWISSMLTSSGRAALRAATSCLAVCIAGG